MDGETILTDGYVANKAILTYIKSKMVVVGEYGVWL